MRPSPRCAWTWMALRFPCRSSSAANPSGAASPPPASPPAHTPSTPPSSTTRVAPAATAGPSKPLRELHAYVLRGHNGLHSVSVCPERRSFGPCHGCRIPQLEGSPIVVDPAKPHHAGGRRGKERAASLRAEQRLAAGGRRLPRPGLALFHEPYQ